MKSRLDGFITELRYAEKSAKTLTKYRGDILKFITFADDESMEVTKDRVLEYKKHLCGGMYKTASINSYLIALNKYFKWLGSADLTVKVIKQQRKSSLEDVISMADYKRLLRFAKKLNLENIYFIMRVLGSTGIRIEELKYITVEAIKTNYIKVNNKGKERDITIPQELCRGLRTYCNKNGIKSGVIFLGKNNEKLISKSTVWRKMKHIAGIARVNKIKVHPHSFRHLFAKEFMKKYNNAIELADILGHNSLDSTRIYMRSTTVEKRNKLDTLGF